MYSSARSPVLSLTVPCSTIGRSRITHTRTLLTIYICNECILCLVSGRACKGIFVIFYFFPFLLLLFSSQLNPGTGFHWISQLNAIKLPKKFCAETFISIIICNTKSTTNTFFVHSGTGWCSKQRHKKRIFFSSSLSLSFCDSCGSRSLYTERTNELRIFDLIECAHV